MTDPDALLQALGRLHPIVVHFPVALLVLAGAIELLRYRSEKPSEAAFVCLFVGAGMAVVSASLGWLYAEHDPLGRSVERTLFLHRWVGVATAVFAIFATVLAAAARRGRSSGPTRLYRLAVFLCAGLVSFGGHLGGTLVYGEGYLLEPFQRSEEPLVAAALPEVEASETEPSTPPGTVDYLTQIQPIFSASCYRCHGPRGKPKAGLRLSDMADVFAGDPADWVIVPGDAEASLVYQRISLPPDHEDSMPAKGDPLTPEAIALIADWIAQGAAWTEVTPDPNAAPPAEVTPDPTAAPPEVEFASTEDVMDAATTSVADVAQRDEAMAAILRAGAHAALVALDTDEVEVNLGVLAATDETLALLDGLEPWLVALDLSRTGVSDRGLARLAGFPGLRRLRLDRTSIGDAGMVHLGGLRSLEVLNLVETRVTDAGLEHLRGLEGLERLYLWGTDVTAPGARSLAEELPGLTIVRVLELLPSSPEPALASDPPCCTAAEARGETCEHPCCVAAAARDEPCPTCSDAGR